MNKLITQLKSSICLTLAVSLIATSGEGVQAAMAMRTPLPEVLAQRGFLRNQEKMRLEMEALNLQLSNSRVLLEKGTFPFPSRLLSVFKGGNLITADQTWSSLIRAQLERIQDWFDTPLVSRYPWVNRSYVAATFVMVIMSQIQAWLAISSGVIIACGNYIEFGNRPLKATLDHMRGPTNDLINRGVLSMGGYFLVPVREKVPAASQIAGFEVGDKPVSIWKYYGSKELILKRDSPVDLLFDALDREAKRAEKDRDPNVPQDISSVEVHSRFATTGDDGSTVDELTDAAQPGIAPRHWELRWEPQKTVTGSTLVWRMVSVENHYQFNGDLNQTRRLQLQMSPEQVIKNQEARDRMLRWLGLESITSGDAPLEALYQDLFYTERMWYPSIRYAMFAHISQPGDEWDRHPPIQRMREWQVLFEHAYRQFLLQNPEMAWTPSEDPSSGDEAKAMQARLAMQSEAFRSYVANLLQANPEQLINFIRATDGHIKFEMLNDLRTAVGSNLNVFLKAATTAFSRNSLEYAAIREIKPRTQGTFGGSHLSSLNPPGSRVMNVTTSNGQGIVIALDKEGKRIAITSDRMIQQQFPQDDADQALVLDDSGNETLVSGMHKSGHIQMTLYSGPDSIVVPDTDVRKRMRPLRDLEDPEVYAQSKGLPELNRMDAGARAAAMQIDTVLQRWKDVRNGIPSRNLQTASEIIRLSIQQRIYEFIRKRIGVNERRLSAELDERIWQRADSLSRASWLKMGPRSMNEAQVMEAAENFAREAEKTIIDNAPLRLGLKAVHELLQDAAQILERAIGSKKDRAVKEESALRTIAGKLIGALNLGGNGHRLEEQSYDIVLIGTESSLMALEKFGLYQLEPMLGMRVKVISGNDFLEIANQYNTDPAGFRKALGINSMRTILMQASDSAETFEAGVDSAWAVTTVNELFTLTGSKDNRLVDRVKKLRSMTTHNPGSKSYDNLKSYVSMIQTLNEFALFWGESVTSRFETGGDDWNHKPFFQTPFTKEQVVQILEPSNERFVKEIAPVVLGYHSSGHEIMGKTSDRAKLEMLGDYMGTRQLEMVRLWFMEKAYLVLTVLFAVLTDIGLVHFQVLGATPGVGAKLISYGIGLTIGFSLGIALLLGMRQLRKALGWHAPKFLAGFGAPSFVFADKYRYVYHFLTLYARTGFGKAYGINSAPFFGSSVNDLIDDYKATANRRAVVLIGRPGPNHPALETADSSAEMAGRQLKSLLNLPFRWMKIFGIKPVAPEVIMMGHYTPPTNDRWWRMARDKDVDFAPENALWTPPGKSLKDMPDHLVRYYEDNYGGFGRMLGGVRALATQVKRVSGHLPTFRPAEYQGGYRIKSTQGPVPGATVLEQVQTMKPVLIPIEPEGGEPEVISDVPVVVKANPIDAVWTSDLPLHGNGKKHRVYPPARPATRQPGSVAAVTGNGNALLSTPGMTAHSGNGNKSTNASVESPAVTVSGNGHSAAQAQVPAEKPSTTLGRGTKLPTGDLRARMERLNKRRPRSTSSMIVKNVSLSANPAAPIAYAFNSDGTLGEANDGTLSEAQLQILQELAQPLPEPLNGSYSLVIADIDNRAAFFQPENKSRKNPKGILVLDRAILDDAVNGVAGAKATLNLEFSAEWVRLQELSQGSAKSQKQETPANLERRLARLKITMFLGYKPKMRQDVIKYLKAHSVYDPKEFPFAEKIYAAANKAYATVYSAALKVDESKEEADRIATRAALDVVKDRLYRYVNGVMAHLKQPAILWPEQPVTAEPLPSDVEDAEVPEVAAPSPSVPNPVLTIAVEPVAPVRHADLNSQLSTQRLTAPASSKPKTEALKSGFPLVRWLFVGVMTIVAWAISGNLVKMGHPNPAPTQASQRTAPAAPTAAAPKPAAPLAVKSMSIESKQGEKLLDLLKRATKTYPELKQAFQGQSIDVVDVSEGTPLYRFWTEVVKPQSEKRDHGTLKVHPGRLLGGYTYDLTPLMPKKGAFNNGLGAARVIRSASALILATGAMVASPFFHAVGVMQGAVPAARTAVSQAVSSGLSFANIEMVTVKSGDTLTQIARNAHKSLAEVSSWNPDVVTQRYIFPGDQIYLGPAHVADSVQAGVMQHLAPSIEAVHTTWSQMVPESLVYAVGVSLVIGSVWILKRYVLSSPRLGQRLKAAVVGFQMVLQLMLPSAALAAGQAPALKDPTPAIELLRQAAAEHDRVAALRKTANGGDAPAEKPLHVGDLSVGLVRERGADLGDPLRAITVTLNSGIPLQRAPGRAAQKRLDALAAAQQERDSLTEKQKAMMTLIDAVLGLRQSTSDQRDAEAMLDSSRRLAAAEANTEQTPVTDAAILAVIEKAKAKTAQAMATVRHMTGVTDVSSLETVGLEDLVDLFQGSDEIADAGLTQSVSDANQVLQKSHITADGALRSRWRKILPTQLNTAFSPNTWKAAGSGWNAIGWWVGVLSPENHWYRIDWKAEAASIDSQVANLKEVRSQVYASWTSQLEDYAALERQTAAAREAVEAQFQAYAAIAASDNHDVALSEWQSSSTVLRDLEKQATSLRLQLRLIGFEASSLDSIGSSAAESTSELASAAAQVRIDTVFNSSIEQLVKDGEAYLKKLDDRKNSKKREVLMASLNSLKALRDSSVKDAVTSEVASVDEAVGDDLPEPKALSAAVTAAPALAYVSERSSVSPDAITFVSEGTTFNAPSGNITWVANSGSIKKASEAVKAARAVAVKATQQADQQAAWMKSAGEVIEAKAVADQLNVLKDTHQHLSEMLSAAVSKTSPEAQQLNAQIKKLETQLRGLQRAQGSLPAADTALPSSDDFHPEALTQKAVSNYEVGVLVSRLKNKDFWNFSLNGFFQRTADYSFAVLELNTFVNPLLHQLNKLFGNDRKGEAAAALVHADELQAEKTMWDVQSELTSAAAWLEQAQRTELAQRDRVEKMRQILSQSPTASSAHYLEYADAYRAWRPSVSVLDQALLRNKAAVAAHSFFEASLGASHRDIPSALQTYLLHMRENKALYRPTLSQRIDEHQRKLVKMFKGDAPAVVSWDGTPAITKVQQDGSGWLPTGYGARFSFKIDARNLAAQHAAIVDGLAKVDQAAAAEQLAKGRQALEYSTIAALKGQEQELLALENRMTQTLNTVPFTSETDRARGLYTLSKISAARAQARAQAEELAQTVGLDAVKIDALDLSKPGAVIHLPGPAEQYVPQLTEAETFAKGASIFSFNPVLTITGFTNGMPGLPRISPNGVTSAGIGANFGSVGVYVNNSAVAEADRKPVTESQKELKQLGHDAQLRFIDGRSDQVIAGVAAQKRISPLFGNDKAHLLQALDLVAKDGADIDSVQAYADATLNSQSLETEAVIAALRSSAELRLSLGHSPEAIMDRSYPKSTLLAEAALLPPPTVTLKVIDSAASKEIAKWRELSRTLTGGTESTAALRTFLTSQQLDTIAPENLLALERVVGLVPEGTSTAERGSALIANLKLAAVALQSDARVRGQRVPTLPQAYADAVRTYKNRNSRFVEIFARARQLSTPAGVTAATALAGALPGETPYSMLVMFAVRQGVWQEKNRKISAETAATHLRITARLATLASHLGLFNDPASDVQLADKLINDSFTFAARFRSVYPAARGTRSPTLAQITTEFEKAVTDALRHVAPLSPAPKTIDAKGAALNTQVTIALAGAGRVLKPQSAAVAPSSTARTPKAAPAPKVKPQEPDYDKLFRSTAPKAPSKAKPQPSVNSPAKDPYDSLPGVGGKGMLNALAFVGLFMVPLSHMAWASTALGHWAIIGLDSLGFLPLVGLLLNRNLFSSVQKSRRLLARSA